jgi:protein-L-isoaspartate(D-aspartate) O-methyltransferase
VSPLSADNNNENQMGKLFMDTRKEDIIAFFKKLDRSFFIDNEFKELAGLNEPLPIGYGQTISQPSLVLEMTLELELDKSCRVLEIGTGSGYQTAFLAEFADAVYTIELIPELAGSAKQKLDALGCNNIFYRIGDGSEGWREHAPYDRIIAAAAAGKMPDKLLDQLKPGGVAIAPVGPKDHQELLRVRKNNDGLITAESLGYVTFVEMKGGYGWGS